MNVQIVQTDPIRVVMLRHVGPYEQMGPTFEKLWEWIERHHVPAGRAIGLFWDNPEHVPAHQLQGAAGAEIPLSFMIDERDGLPLEIMQIDGGEYATTRYVGPYEEMEPVWSKFMKHVDRPPRKISDKPAIEVYVNDPADTPADALVTELYLPLE